MDKKTQTYLAIGGVALAAYLATRKQQPAAKGGGGEGPVEGEDPKPEIYGCTDIFAPNYDATANVDDGSCITEYPEVPIQEVFLPEVCLSTACENYSQLAPLAWYILQALNYDVSQIENPCTSFNVLFNLTDGNGDKYISSAFGLEVLSNFNAYADNFSAEYVESIVYSDFWLSDYTPSIYDSATGQPMPDFLPFTSDCTIDPTLYMFQWGDLVNHWQSWAAASNDTLGTDLDPCGWRGMLASTALGTIDFSSGSISVAYMSKQLLDSIQMPAPFNDPFNEDGTFKYPFADIANAAFDLLSQTYPQCYNSL